MSDPFAPWDEVLQRLDELSKKYDELSAALTDLEQKLTQLSWHRRWEGTHESGKESKR